MRKSILIFLAAFTFSTCLTSCRETNETDDVEVNNEMEELGEEIEAEAEEAEGTGQSFQESTEEVEQEVQTTDDY